MSALVVDSFTLLVLLFVSGKCVGNNQKKANALIEASGLKMIGIDDFDRAAKTVSSTP